MKKLTLILASQFTRVSGTPSRTAMRAVMGTVLLFTVGTFGLVSQDSAAEEEYYTWIDENGVTNYAERNPEGVNATFVSRNQAFGRRLAEREEARQNEGRPQGSSSLPTTETQEIDPDALVDENAAALAAELAAAKRQNCEAGKNNLAQLKAFARIRVADENGVERVLTDEEKEVKADEARKVIRENCTG